MSPRLIEIAAHIRDAGSAGISTMQLAGHLGITRKSAYNLIERAIDGGLVRGKPAPVGRCANRMVWIATGSAPVSVPRPLPSISPRTYQIPAIAASRPGVPAEHRYRVHALPDGYVSQLDASDCRPWAQAVA